MTTPVTTLRIAVDALLGPDTALEDFVRIRRGANLSWRRIALELHAETGVDITHESLRNWFPEIKKGVAA